MWLEERTGKRINEERIDDALALDPDTVSTACPYCMVMLGDAVNAKKAAGEAEDSWAGRWTKSALVELYLPTSVAQGQRPPP